MEAETERMGLSGKRNNPNDLTAPAVIVGNGGHALVLRDAMLWPGAQWRALAIQVVNRAEDVTQAPDSVTLVNGIGDLEARYRIASDLRARGYRFAIIVHPRAIVSPYATLGDGCQVMAGAIVQAGASIGADSIINTNASIDHHCSIGECSHIAPGATLCGNVTVGPRTLIGAGAVVTPGVTIGARQLVKAGARLSKRLADLRLV